MSVSTKHEQFNSLSQYKENCKFPGTTSVAVRCCYDNVAQIFTLVGVSCFILNVIKCRWIFDLETLLLKQSFVQSSHVYENKMFVFEQCLLVIFDCFSE